MVVWRKDCRGCVEKVLLARQSRFEDHGSGSSPNAAGKLPRSRILGLLIHACNEVQKRLEGPLFVHLGTAESNT